jgi:hypothetical protein
MICTYNKEKVKLAKGYKRSYSTEIFRIVKIINRTPHSVYNLADLNDLPREGQFYMYELVKVIVSSHSTK